MDDGWCFSAWMVKLLRNKVFVLWWC
jgi:hypothetical protein